MEGNGSAKVVNTIEMEADNELRLKTSDKRLNTSKTDIMGKISDFVDQLRLDYVDSEQEDSQPNRPRSSINAPGVTGGSEIDGTNLGGN